MKTSYELFSKYKEEKFKNLKFNYLESVNKARNKKKVSMDFQSNLSRDEYKKIQNKLGDYSNAIILIKDELERDKDKTLEKEFNRNSKSFPTKEKNKIIQLLAELDAMDDFFIYWNTLEFNSQKEKIQTKEKIYWKGNNETEFIQLIYMLFHSKLLSNESNEKTKLVKQVAEIFNYEIGKNWQTNLSASKQKRKNGYKPEIIQKLDDAWEYYSNIKQ